MKRNMRRFKQKLPAPEVKQILTQATNGVLSLTDGNGEPYGVPISFVYDGAHTVYFHSASQGHKMECIRSNDRASFCVVSLDDIQPEAFTTYFKSVILSGRISRVENPDETIKGLRMLGNKYSPGIDSEAEISNCLKHVTVMRLDIESMTGKEAVELTRKRPQR